MTDKEIIIDGVNVAKCVAFDKWERCNNLYPCDGEICSFKYDSLLEQLQIKEQYLETICKTFDIEYIRDKETNQIIAKCNKLLAKEQECEEYKAQAKKYLADYYEENKKCEELKETIKMFASTLDNLLKGLIQVCQEHIDSTIPDDWENEEIVADISDYIRTLKHKIQKLQADNEGLRQWQKDAENILKTQLDNFDKIENRYKQALEKIEEIAKDINLTIMGGEDSPKDEWVNLYTTR